mgnify:CR=1 FL=1
MQARDIRPHEILLPVNGVFIAATFVAALLINLLPWSGVWLYIKPDFVALVVLYWCIQQPRKVGFMSAWLLGILMDVAFDNNGDLDRESYMVEVKHPLGRGACDRPRDAQQGSSRHLRDRRTAQARLDQRPVEAAAVVGDQQRPGRADAVRDEAREQHALLCG